MSRTPDDILDELLVLQAQDGDGHALHTLLLRWQSRLRARARALANRPDAQDDILQQTLLAIARGLHRLDDPAAFPAWAMRIVAFKVRDWLRAEQRSRRRQRQLAGADRDRYAPHAPSGTEPSHVHPAHDTLAGALPSPALIRLALDALPIHHRALLILHYARDVPIDALARSLGIPPGTVKSRLFHARRALRELLDSYGPGAPLVPGRNVPVPSPSLRSGVHER